MGKRIGWWLQISSVGQSYTPIEFFNSNFLTEPYPSFVEMIFSEINQITGKQSWMQSVATMAKAYPSIEISCMLAFDMADESHWTKVEAFVNAMIDTAVRYIGVDGEHALNESVANYDRLKTMVESKGFIFASYYTYTVPDAPGYVIGHTNFPWWNDMEAILDWHNVFPPNIGQSAGGYDKQIWPSPEPPPPNPTTRTDCRWSKRTIEMVLEHAVPKSDDARHAVVYVAGFSNDPFIGVSGRTTTHLWDNPQFRAWIWEKMQTYPEGTFITSTFIQTHNIIIQSTPSGIPFTIR